MTVEPGARQAISTSALYLEFGVVPWDTETFGFPVAEISDFTLRDPAVAHRDFGQYEQWREAHGVRMTSCRIDSMRLRESMFLEERGFRFVEMAYRPRLDQVQKVPVAAEDRIQIEDVGGGDLTSVLDIAASSFDFGRFNVDPRIGATFGDRRYLDWVRRAAASSSQRVLQVGFNGSPSAFMIVEYRPQDCCYWHLTAVAQKVRGHGIGKRIWKAMIMRNKDEGVERIETTISAHNIPVINLYASLGFRFLKPMSTFHWWQEG